MINNYFSLNIKAQNVDKNVFFFNSIFRIFLGVQHCSLHFLTEVLLEM